MVNNAVLSIFTHQVIETSRKAIEASICLNLGLKVWVKKPKWEI